MNFTVPICRIHGGRYRSCHGSGVESYTEFPTIGQVNPNKVAGTDAGSDQTARRLLYKLCVLPVGHAPMGCTGGINNGDFSCVAFTGFENHLVNKLIAWVSVKVSLG